MEIYEFKKSLPVRLEECMLVLSWSDKLIPASQVRDEWSYFIQLQVEPGGWQALWKIPRTICEDLNIQFPTMVFGIVEHVMYKELKAIFTVQAVEEEYIHLPERQEVNLEDLYPTKIQENNALNVEKTADCIDSLRFFYKNIWMPWDNDNDDDLDWSKKHLESRLQFYYDLQKKIIKRSIANHVKNLLHEARYIQSRRQYLEMDLSDNEDLEETTSNKNLTALLKMHLRLKIIKNEIELLENPEIRKIYEDLKSDEENIKTYLDENFNIFLVMEPCTLEDQQKILDSAKKTISDKALIRICSSLQEALEVSHKNDLIILNSGQYSIKFLEYLNEKGTISGLMPQSDKSIISSIDDESILFVFDGDFTLQNLTLDCKNIRTGIFIKSGVVKVLNCHIIGDEHSSTKQGIQLSGNSSLIIENSKIENFAVGIKLVEDSSVALINTVIEGCLNGIEINQKSKINCKKVTILRSKTAGIIYETRNLNTNKNCIVLNNFNDSSNSFEMPWDGDCIFEENTKNIIVYNRKVKTYKEIVQEDLLEDSFEFISPGIEDNYTSFDSSMGTTITSDSSPIIVDSSE